MPLSVSTGSWAWSAGPTFSLLFLFMLFLHKSQTRYSFAHWHLNAIPFILHILSGFLSIHLRFHLLEPHVWTNILIGQLLAELEVRQHLQWSSSSFSLYFMWTSKMWYPSWTQAGIKHLGLPKCSVVDVAQHGPTETLRNSVRSNDKTKSNLELSVYTRDMDISRLDSSVGAAWSCLTVSSHFSAEKGCRSGAWTL